MIISGGAREQKLHCNLFFLKLIILVINVLVSVWLVYFLIFVWSWFLVTGQILECSLCFSLA